MRFVNHYLAGHRIIPTQEASSCPPFSSSTAAPRARPRSRSSSSRRRSTRLRSQNPGLKVVERDLGANPVPHLTADDGRRACAATDTAGAARSPQALSDALIDELKAADTIVIGAPMYNFGIPSTLKAWFDHVLRAGVTFRYTDAGPEGLLKGKRVIVVESRGGLYSEGPAQPMDFAGAAPAHVLGFIGITDVTFVRAEKLGYGPEAREEAISDAHAELALVA